MSSAPLMQAPHRLWGGRFAEGPAPEMDRLNTSLDVDHRLWREDIAGSQAWATALGAAGVIEQQEAATLRSGLDRVAARLAKWTPRDWAAATDEDIHTLVERLLGEEVGAVAGSCTPAARATIRLPRTRVCGHSAPSPAWTPRCGAAAGAARPGRRARRHDHARVHAPAAGAAGFRRALAPFPRLAAGRDRQRLADARRRVAVLPLGSGAIAGCPFPVDRVLLKETLGFSELSANSIDAVADRDWVAELVWVLAMTGVHLSRLGEDLVIYASTEFGLVRLGEQWSTGSSLMPQKRNPDAMELARAKAGRLIGDLTAVLTLLKGCPPVTTRISRKTRPRSSMPSIRWKCCSPRWPVLFAR